jgi:hypothetical protein
MSPEVPPDIYGRHHADYLGDSGNVTNQKKNSNDFLVAVAGLVSFPRLRGVI